ncbi:unnamed protein product, partial [Vitis vinifera]
MTLYLVEQPVVIDRHDRRPEWRREESVLQPMEIESYNCLSEIWANLIQLLRKTFLGVAE